MQFIAECGIEYGLQFVTQFFLNSPDCLYIKKYCNFLQSYKKSRAIQNKFAFIFIAEQSNFGRAKVTKKRAKYKIFKILFVPLRSKFNLSSYEKHLYSDGRTS